MNQKTSEPSISAPEGVSLNPWQILQAIVKALPVMRYALGVLGLAAVLAIVSAWRLDFKVAFCGALGILGLMVVLVLFARVTVRSHIKGDRDFLYFASIFVVCAFGFLVTCAAFLLLSASTFGWPKELHELLFPGRGNSLDGIW